MNQQGAITEARELGAEIRAVRKEAGFTQEEFAARLWTTQAHVSKWETGTVAPGLMPLLRIGMWARGATRERLIEHVRLFLEAHGLVQFVGDIGGGVR